MSPSALDDLLFYTPIKNPTSCADTERVSSISVVCDNSFLASVCGAVHSKSQYFNMADVAQLNSDPDRLQFA